MWSEKLESPHPTPERHMFKGIFSLTDWTDESEQFVGLLAEHDLQYREMYVNGDYWLLDSPWNRFLVKCVDHLEKFGLYWSNSEGDLSLTIR
jgi:hypothetical protein